MRVIILFSLLAFPLWAQASSKELLLINVKYKYSKSFMKIYQEENKYKCDTENQPPFNLSENPVKDLKLPKESEIVKKANCRDQVEIRLGTKSVNGCLDDPTIKTFVTSFNKICRY